MSEKALIDTIQVEINVKRAEGREWLIAAPEIMDSDFLKQTLRDSRRSCRKMQQLCRGNH